MFRSLAAVLGGYVSIGVLVILTDLVVAAIRPGEYAAGKTPPLYYFVVSMLTAPLYSVLGGWICARIAAKNPRPHVLALIVSGELMGVVSTVMFWGRQPWWYAAWLLVIYPVAVWFGGTRVRNEAHLAAARGN